MQRSRLIDEYCVWHEVCGHSHKTMQWYRWILTTFAQWLEATGRSTRITEITVHDARAFLQIEAGRDQIARNNVNARAGKLSDRTLHAYTRAIRAFFHWLAREEYLERNPMGKLNLPKLEKRYKAVLSASEDIQWHDYQLRVMGKGKQEQFVPFSPMTHRMYSGIVQPWHTS